MIKNFSEETLSQVSLKSGSSKVYDLNLINSSNLPLESQELTLSNSECMSGSSNDFLKDTNDKALPNQLASASPS